MTASDSNPGIPNPGIPAGVTRAHWIGLLWVLAISCGVLLAIGWGGIWHPVLDEKRTLATRPALPHSLAQLRAYPTAFDAYVHDQFPPRGQLIAGLNYLRYRFGYSGSPRVVVGNHGWLFYDNGDHLGYPAARAPMSATDLDVWTSVLAARQQRLADHNIPYVVLVAPARESLYADRLPRWSRRARAGRNDDQDAINNALKARGLSGVIDLRPTFAAAIAHGDYLYTPFDIHWDGRGAYLGYRQLLHALSSRFPQLQPRPLSDFPPDTLSGQPRDLALMLGIAGFIRQDYPQYLAPPSPMPTRVRYLGTRAYWTEPHVITTGFPGPRLLMTMDSFSNALLPFLQPHFSEIVIAHTQDGYFRPDLIDRFHPDIVLLEVFASSLRFSMDSVKSSASESAALPLPQFAALPSTPSIPSEPLDCNLENVSLVAAGNQSPMSAREVQLSGWAAQVARQRSATQVRIILHSPQAMFAATLSVDVVRADVSAHFQRSGIALSGFDARASLSAVPPGHYTIALEQQYPDGAAICRTANVLDIH